MADQRSALPPRPPKDFVWQLTLDGWKLVEDTFPKTWYRIIGDGQWRCGYASREEAERFLPHYQHYWPDAHVEEWTDD